MMTAKELIAGYVVNSRKILSHDSIRDNSFYRSIINSLIESYEIDASCDLEIIECCSIDKFSFVLPRNEIGKVFFVYDVYLETINNFFNFFLCYRIRGL
jgi:hypothetical protein